MAKKKTTLMLDEGLYDKIRLKAAERRESMSNVVAEGMARYLAEPSTAPRPQIKIPVTSAVMKPFPPHVNIDSATAIAEYLDEIEEEERRAKGTEE